MLESFQYKNKYVFDAQKRSNITHFPFYLFKIRTYSREYALSDITMVYAFNSLNRKGSKELFT